MNQLGKYELLNPLGSGATSEVYLARDTALGRKVALKVLKPALVADPSAFERFSREAQAASELFHPNIATVLDMGEADGRYFIALRYIEGQSLDHRIAEKGPLPWDEALRMTKEIGEALDFSHAEGFMHRDVKPTNILCSQKSDFVLTDFGLMRAMMSTGLTSHTGAVLGTPPYIAPEIWNGKEASPASDQYALACVLFEAITGEVLFGGTTPQEIITKHLVKRPEFPEIWAKDVPSDIKFIIGRALSANIIDRFENLKDFVSALNKQDDASSNLGKVLPKAESNTQELKTEVSDKQKQVKPEKQTVGQANEKAQGHFAKGVDSIENYAPKDRINFLTEAIRLQPDFAEAYYQRALLRKEMGKSKEAIRDLDEAIRINPKSFEAYVLRGQMKGRSKEAIQDFTDAIKINSKCTEAYYHRGIVFAFYSGLASAVEDFTKVIQLNPEDEKAYFHRGLVYKLNQNIDMAIQDFTDAINLNSDYIEAHYNRHLAWKTKKDYDAAKADLEQYKLLKKKYKDANIEKLSYLKAIGFHLLSGFGLFYVDNSLWRKWLYPILPLWALLDYLAAVTGFDVFTDPTEAVFALFLYSLSFMDVIITCRSRRKLHY